MKDFLLPFVVVYGAAAVIGCVTHFFRSRWRRALIGDPPPLSVSDLWREFYERRDVGADEFGDVWNTICKEAAVDATRLRPTDQLAPFLSRKFLNPMDEWGDVGDLILFRAKKAGIAVQLESMRTVDDCVMALLQIRRATTAEAGRQS